MQEKSVDITSGNRARTNITNQTVISQAADPGLACMGHVSMYMQVKLSMGMNRNKDVYMFASVKCFDVHVAKQNLNLLNIISPFASRCGHE